MSLLGRHRWRDTTTRRSRSAILQPFAPAPPRSGCTEIPTASPKFRLPVIQLDAASYWLAEATDICRKRSDHR